MCLCIFPSFLSPEVSSVQFSHSVMSDCLWPHEPQHAWPPCPSPTPRAKLMSITNSTSQTHVHWIGDAIQPFILCCPLLLPPSIFPSLMVFPNKSALHIRWSKYWSFSFNISLPNEHPGQISFRMDWLDPLAVQGTLKSLFQHHSSKASILLCSAFFIVQFSHPYMTTGKTIALIAAVAAAKLLQSCPTLCDP